MMRNDSKATLGARIFDAAVPAILQIIRSLERGEISLVNGRPERSRDWREASFQSPAIDDDLLADTAERIATTRAAADGREGVRSFLEKRKPLWVSEYEAERAAAEDDDEEM